MKPINIYTLTRISKTSDLDRLERQMSGRGRYLKIKEWEIEGLRDFCGRLAEAMQDAVGLHFYYSFTMPKLGKEFDLLRVNEECVVNVELKSGDVTDEAIRKQLLQNRYYLATLGRSMYSYTYVSGQERLVRLSNSGRLVEADWEELAKVLERQTGCYSGHIEELFKEDKYLISPLTDPGRFLRQEYFLTSQQRDIKKRILKKIQQDKENWQNGRCEEKGACGMSIQGFTGLPGTGKTLLLYDIAMELSWREKVCVLHFGSHERELEQLDERLKRIDFYYCEAGRLAVIPNRYSAIFADEGHRIDEAALKNILDYAAEWKAPVVFSYDCEDMISPGERRQDGAVLIEEIPEFTGHRLTNRIRMNSELSSFIGSVMYLRGGNHRHEYPSVALAYANDAEEAECLLRNFETEGYVYIQDAAAAACKEYERVVMMMDHGFWYDETGYLRHVASGSWRDAVGEDGVAAGSQTGAGTEHIAGDSAVRNLFHGLSRAKVNVAVIVQENEAVFEVLLSIVQKGIA